MALRWRPPSSVPTEMHDRSTATSAVPGSQAGAGTSSATTSPRRMRTCFMTLPMEEKSDGKRLGALDVVRAVLAAVVLRVVVAVVIEVDAIEHRAEDVHVGGEQLIDGGLRHAPARHLGANYEHGAVSDVCDDRRVR